MYFKGDMIDKDFTEAEMEKVVIPFRKVCVAFGSALYHTIHLDVTEEAPSTLWSNFADEACSFINSMED